MRGEFGTFSEDTLLKIQEISLKSAEKMVEKKFFLLI